MTDGAHEEGREVVIWFAGAIDDALIWFYTWKGGADTPCGRIQSWARETRQGDGYITTMKAKKFLDK